MKNSLFIFILICSCAPISQAQIGGMRAYGGTSTMTNNDIIVNPEGHYHSGYHIGADGRLMSGTMSFLVGGRFTSVSGSAIDGFAISGHDSKLSIINGRVGLDYSLVTFSNIFRVRTKVLASFDLVLAGDNPTQSPGYTYNDGWLGMVSGIGFDIGPIILDVEYEYGIINAYNKKSGSTFNSWSVSAGFFF